jgi:hypothetical protein
MRTLKSFWFWLLVVWILVAGLAAWILVLKLPAWTWICTAGIVAWLVVGIGLALFLRQKALIKVLSKGAKAQSSDNFEESWKTGFASDVRKLLDGLGTELPGRSASALRQRRLVWTVSADFEASRRFLSASGAVDATESRRHELSGEFQALANWLTRKDEIFVLLRELPDPRVPATLARAGFLLELLSQRGKVRPVDAALVLSPLQKEVLPPAIHAAVGYLAEASGVEFPIYLALHGAESLPGGDAFFRVCPRSARCHPALDPPGRSSPGLRPGLGAHGRRHRRQGKRTPGVGLGQSRFPPKTSSSSWIPSARSARAPSPPPSPARASSWASPIPSCAGSTCSPPSSSSRRPRPRPSPHPRPMRCSSDRRRSRTTRPLPPGPPPPAAAETSVAALEAFLEHLHAEPALARLGAAARSRPRPCR